VVAGLAKQSGGAAGASRALRLAPRPVFLAGREELLAEVNARLTADETGEPRVVALYGLGGAGKTSVALEYAHRHLSEVGVAWQFPAEDPTVLTAAFAGSPPSSGSGTPATGWCRCMGFWPPTRPGGCWCSTTRRIGPQSHRSFPRPGAGRC
jgi:AAA ATPase domain